ncbi:uncharacterized protein LOC119920819 [Tachyglossus aculeatus]|uniref:uncharacterized protein LOC119920819 n=1 Tax=Tachyglossus aculeatus TaxID=9261 RepID=UPI0018F3FB49|nr:uncharacterized protein LOC119920819 [Tachyglossus aculeatus]
MIFPGLFLGQALIFTTMESYSCDACSGSLSPDIHLSWPSRTGCQNSFCAYDDGYSSIVCECRPNLNLPLFNFALHEYSLEVLLGINCMIPGVKDLNFETILDWTDPPACFTGKFKEIHSQFAVSLASPRPPPPCSSFFLSTPREKPPAPSPLGEGRWGCPEAPLPFATFFRRPSFLGFDTEGRRRKPPASHLLGTGGEVVTPKKDASDTQESKAEEWGIPRDLKHSVATSGGEGQHYCKSSMLKKTCINHASWKQTNPRQKRRSSDRHLALGSQNNT